MSAVRSLFLDTMADVAVDEDTTIRLRYGNQ